MLAVCSTIMETLEKPAFVASTRITAYENVEERRTVIISNLLNNRNKNAESVLDCALAHACVEMVDFLTVHPLCDVEMQKGCKTQVGAKCSVKPLPKAVVEEISSMLEGRW